MGLNERLEEEEERTSAGVSLLGRVHKGEGALAYGVQYAHHVAAPRKRHDAVSL